MNPPVDLISFFEKLTERRKHELYSPMRMRGRLPASSTGRCGINGLRERRGERSKVDSAANDLRSLLPRTAERRATDASGPSVSNSSAPPRSAKCCSSIHTDRRKTPPAGGVSTMGRLIARNQEDPASDLCHNGPALEVDRSPGQTTHRASVQHLQCR